MICGKKNTWKKRIIVSIKPITYTDQFFNHFFIQNVNVTVSEEKICNKTFNTFEA